MTKAAWSVFGYNQIFAPDHFEEMFNQIIHSERFGQCLKQPRPDIEASTISLKGNQQRDVIGPPPIFVTSESPQVTTTINNIR